MGYNFNANSILATPLKKRTAPVLTQAWKKLHNKYTQAAVAPQMYILDNEFSQELENALVKENCKSQLVPRNAHMNILAERAIQTWKSHFKAGLETCDSDFPLREWDRLIEQANITLNFLRSSRSNPKLSA